MAGIYSVTSPSGAIYVGKTTKPFKERFRHYHTLHCKKQHKLYASFIKYGVDSHIFKIEEEFPDDDIYLKSIDLFEECIFLHYKEKVGNMMNIRYPSINPIHSKETKEIISNKLKGNKRSAESIEKCRQTKIKNGTTGKGIPKPQSVKDKIRETLKGRKTPECVIKKRLKTRIERGNLFGRVCTEEAKRKQSEKMKGRPSKIKGVKKSEESKIKMRETLRLKKLYHETINNR